MSVHFFTVPALEPETAAAELNAFLASHRVLASEAHFVQDGNRSYWAFKVTVSASAGPLPDALKASSKSSRSRIDYREVLAPEDFAIYAELRRWRAETAEREGIALYNVFTNEQLAAVVTGRITSRAALRKIAGVGAARLERFGEALLARMATLLESAPPPTPDEAAPDGAQ